MPINTDLLICTRDLQQYLVDKTTGEALSAGVITCYKDSSRTTLKNWYYQSGTAGAYTYIALPNPLTLSSVGTINDVNGNDVLPFYFPYSETDNSVSEPYYITVDNANGVRQFTRANFPFTGDDNTGNTVPTFRNYIVNNAWWRQFFTGYSALPGGATYENIVDLSNYTDVVIAPSSNAGFSMPDWRFQKDVAGSTDTLTFKRFSLGSTQLTGDITPEYYINHNCTAFVTEQYKYYQAPIVLHIKNLDSVPATFTIQAKYESGSADQKIIFKILQFYGTGATASPSAITEKEFTLTTDWQKYKHNFTFPSGASATLNGTGDDAYYLQIWMPVSARFNISFTLPSLYLDSDVPTNAFTTYDQVDAIIDSPRTGDYRQSLNRVLLGWIPANDGTIGNYASSATCRANQDTWPLYSLLWNNVSVTWCPMADGFARGANAYTDFLANRAMYLTKNLGRVLQGLDPIFITPSTFTATLTPLVFTVGGPFAPSSPTITAANTFTAGTPIQVSSTVSLPITYGQPGSYGQGIYGTSILLTANTTYYVSANNLTNATFEITTNLADAVAGTNSIQFQSAGVGVLTITNTVNTLTLATSQSPLLKAGTAVVFSNTGGALPAGLSAATVYYITTTSLTATTITVNNNLTDALNGYFLPILSAGTGTNTVSNALGAYSGASYTTQVASHYHQENDYSTRVADQLGAVTGSSGIYSVANSPGNLTTYVDGIEKVSLIQPTALVNTFIKL